MENKNINWEKVGVYLAILTMVVMLASKILDISERIAKIEVKVDKLEEKK